MLRGRDHQCGQQHIHVPTSSTNQREEKLGYTYVEKWECDFERELKANVTMYNFINSLEMISALEPREAFYEEEQRPLPYTKRPRRKPSTILT